MTNPAPKNLFLSIALGIVTTFLIGGLINPCHCGALAGLAGPTQCTWIRSAAEMFIAGLFMGFSEIVIIASSMIWYSALRQQSRLLINGLILGLVVMVLYSYFTSYRPA